MSAAKSNVMLSELSEPETTSDSEDKVEIIEIYKNLSTQCEDVLNKIKTRKKKQKK